MRAVITVIGKDAVGILSKISTVCAENNANVVEVTQSVLQEFFAMIMLVEIDNTDFAVLSEKLEEAGKELGMQVRIMHEDLFNAMHTI